MKITDAISPEELRRWCETRRLAGCTPGRHELGDDRSDLRGRRALDEPVLDRTGHRVARRPPARAGRFDARVWSQDAVREPQGQCLGGPVAVCPPGPDRYGTLRFRSYQPPPLCR